MTCSPAWDTQATCFVQQHAHQRICVDMTLHDGIYASLAGEPRSGRCRLTVTIYGCNAGSAWIPSVLFGKVGYFSSVTDQAWPDQAEGHCLQQGVKHQGLTRTYHSQPYRPFGLGPIDQALHAPHFDVHCMCLFCVRRGLTQMIRMPCNIDLRRSGALSGMAAEVAPRRLAAAERRPAFCKPPVTATCNDSCAPILPSRLANP